MKHYVGIVGLGNDGGTFLDWSIHYLSGYKKMYYLIDRYGLALKLKHNNFNIPNNPILNKTAHKHRKNHPNENTLDDFYKIAQEIEPIGTNIFSYYLVIEKNPCNSHKQYVIETAIKYHSTKFLILNPTIKSIPMLIERTKKLKINLVTEDYYKKNYIDNLDGISNVYILDIIDVFQNLNTKIFDIFKFLNLSLYQNNFSHWSSIYKKWQSINFY